MGIKLIKRAGGGGGGGGDVPADVLAGLNAANPALSASNPALSKGNIKQAWSTATGAANEVVSQKFLSDFFRPDNLTLDQFGPRSLFGGYASGETSTAIRGYASNGGTAIGAYDAYDSASAAGKGSVALGYGNAYGECSFAQGGALVDSGSRNIAFGECWINGVAGAVVFSNNGETIDVTSSSLGNNVAVFGNPEETDRRMLGMKELTVGAWVANSLLGGKVVMSGCSDMYDSVSFVGVRVYATDGLTLNKGGLIADWGNRGFLTRVEEDHDVSNDPQSNLYHMNVVRVGDNLHFKFGDGKSAILALT